MVSIPRPASAGAIFHAQQHRPPLRSVDPLDVTEAVRGWEGEGGLESPVVGGEDEEAAMRVRQEALDRYLAHSPTRMLRDGGAAGPPAAESESCALSATPCCPERARFFKELKEKERRYLRRKETGVLSSEEASLLDGSARFDPQGYTVITNVRAIALSLSCPSLSPPFFFLCFVVVSQLVCVCGTLSGLLGVWANDRSSAGHCPLSTLPPWICLSAVEARMCKRTTDWAVTMAARIQRAAALHVNPLARAPP